MLHVPWETSWSWVHSWVTKDLRVALDMHRGLRLFECCGSNLIERQVQ